MEESIQYFFDLGETIPPLLHSATWNAETGGLLVAASCIAIGLYHVDPDTHQQQSIAICSAVLRALLCSQFPIVRCTPLLWSLYKLRTVNRWRPLRIVLLTVCYRCAKLEFSRRILPLQSEILDC